MAREARAAGLLTEHGFERLIEEAIRREAGTKFLDAMRRMRDANDLPLSKLRESVEGRGGRSATFPDLADRVPDDLYSKRLSIVRDALGLKNNDAL